MTRSVLPDDLFRRLVRARELIDDAHAEPLTLESMARAASLSPYHFLRVFREAFGETPGRYHTRVRIARAKDALLRGASVTEACFEVGFSSLGSFSSLFSREVACSPSAFQRQARAFAQVSGWIGAAYVPHCFFWRYVADRNSREAKAPPAVIPALGEGGMHDDSEAVAHDRLRP